MFSSLIGNHVDLGMKQGVEKEALELSFLTVGNKKKKNKNSKNDKSTIQNIDLIENWFLVNVKRKTKRRDTDTVVDLTAFF